MVDNILGESVKNSVYTDLDSIFDTRAVMIAALTNKGNQSINLKKADYHHRVRDNFGTLSERIFHYYYKERSNNVLSNAPLTSVPDIIKEYWFDRMSNSQEDLQCTLYINFYPYNLSYEENSTMVALFKKLFPGVTIKTIDIPPKEIESEWVCDHVGMFISYSAMEWIERYTDNHNGLNPKLLDVTILAPCILQGVVVSGDLTTETIDNIGRLFKIMANFNFLNSSAFTSKVITE